MNLETKAKVGRAQTELAALKREERRLFDTFNRCMDAGWKIAHLKSYVEVLERQLEVQGQLKTWEQP